MSKGSDMREMVRDRLWLWGHPAGCHTRSPEQWGLPGSSRITPAEAGRYLDIPNVLMVRYELEPAPPFAEHAQPLAGLQQIVWSIEGGGGGDVDAVLELSTILPNLRGVILDDYFARVTALKNLRERLYAGARRLDIWVVLYTHEFASEAVLHPHLELCDVVTLWTWQAADLVQLEANFTRFEQIVGERRKVLGLYLWDYSTKQPLPLAEMAKQCTLGLRWLEEGRLDGLIFLASCLCDLQLDVVEWTRRWIAEHGQRRLSDCPIRGVFISCWDAKPYVAQRRYG